MAHGGRGGFVWPQVATGGLSGLGGGGSGPGCGHEGGGEAGEGGVGVDTGEMLRAVDDFDLATHPVVVVPRQVAGHLDDARLIEAVRRHTLLVGPDGELAWLRRVLGLGAVAVAGVDIGCTDDELVVDRVVVAHHEADLRSHLDAQCRGEEPAVLDVDDDGHGAGSQRDRRRGLVRGSENEATEGDRGTGDDRSNQWREAVHGATRVAC